MYFLYVVSKSSCDAIADLRRKLQRVSNNNIVFLDETHIKINEAPCTTLVAPKQKQFVLVEDTTSYAARYDMIAAVVGDQVLPPMIYSPQDRASRGVQGIQAKMLIEFIEDVLARAISGLDRYPIILVLDRATIHSIDKVREAFHNVGCEELKEVILMPTQAAKRTSPLDNALFHEWKERVRKNFPLTKNNIITVMNNEWHNTKPQNIRNYYNHCCITRGQNVYKDCPKPNTHHHPS
jgi:hypothetical protein